MGRKLFKRLVSKQYKKTRLNGYVYDFRVDYDAIAVDDTLHIHSHLMKKSDFYRLKQA